MSNFISKEKAIDFINSVPSNEPILLTIGFAMRNPTTCNKELSHEAAIDWVENHGQRYWLETGQDNDKRYHLNAYTANDMY